MSRASLRSPDSSRFVSNAPPYSACASKISTTVSARTTPSETRRSGRRTRVSYCRMGWMRKPQPWPIRLSHWVNVPALAIMAMSGLQILVAYPYMGPRGGMWSWWPLQDWHPPEWLRVGQWLAGARAWHFAMAWLLVGNAAIWLGYLAASGEWRRRFFWPPRDTGPALRQLAYYLRLRREPPPVDLYNGLQRMAYTTALGLGVVE